MMDRYIEQIISDIRLSRTYIKPPITELWESVDINNPNEVEDIAYIESGMANPVQLSEITGIETETLPVEEALSSIQKALLANELLALLHHYNFYPNFPEGYPDELKYAHLLMIWDNKYSPVSFGETQIEFCDFDSKNCPFGGYCDTCAEMEQELLNSRKADKDDGSFTPFPDELLPF
jgi:hypothetical protein